jgi:hypothetical protein
MGERECSIVVTALECDDDELALCLKSADDEFEEEEEKCREQHPDLGGEYTECRTDARETRDIVRSGCYETHCERKAE